MSVAEGIVDCSAVQTRITRVSPGCIKEGGVKTDKPLIDAATQKRVWWAQGKFYPQASRGGEDADVLFAVLADECPIVLQYEETPLVELVDARVRFGSRLSLVCSGVKRVATKAAK